MSKLRLLFIKEAQASYISHLDLMRTFQRVFPRAGLSLRHSNGFHPHPIISIVLPLPVGQESDCELLDFETVEDSDGAGVAEALNTGMPAGIRVLDCYPAERPVKALSFIRADMELDYDGGVPGNAVEKINELFARDEVLVEKRTKHKDLTEINIRPMIESLTFAEGENKLCAKVTVMAQNPGLNPAFIGAAIARYLPELAPDFVRVRRRELLDAEMKEFR